MGWEMEMDEMLMFRLNVCGDHFGGGGDDCYCDEEESSGRGCSLLGFRVNLQL